MKSYENIYGANLGTQIEKYERIHHESVELYKRVYFLVESHSDLKRVLNMPE